jgi:hypothetical protein
LEDEVEVECAGDAAGDEMEVEAESLRSWRATVVGSSRPTAQSQEACILISPAAAVAASVVAPEPEPWSGGGAIGTSGPWSRSSWPVLALRRAPLSGSDPRNAARTPRICARFKGNQYF